MRFLLDTHLLIWSSGDRRRLSASALTYMEDPANEFWFSATSIWEIAIKFGLGQSDFTVDPKRVRVLLEKTGFRELALSAEHAAGLTSLPSIHKDPFDRILIAQAMVEGLTLLTADATVGTYPGPIMKV